MRDKKSILLWVHKALSITPSLILNHDSKIRAGTASASSLLWVFGSLHSFSCNYHSPSLAGPDGANMESLPWHARGWSCSACTSLHIPHSSPMGDTVPIYCRESRISTMWFWEEDSALLDFTSGVGRCSRLRPLHTSPARYYSEALLEKKHKKGKLNFQHLFPAPRPQESQQVISGTLLLCYRWT